MSLKQILLWLSFEILIYARAARILAYHPSASISHQVVFRPITLKLIKHGHEVTVITPDPMFPEGDAPVNLTEIDVHDASYEILRKHFTSSVTGKGSDLVNQLHTTMAIIPKLFEKQINVTSVKNLLKNCATKFDLILLEALNTPALGMTHIFQAPTILISSLGAFPGNYEIVGAPTHPTIYHNFLRQRLYNLTWWEKIMEVVNQLRIYNEINSSEKEYNKVLQRIFGPDIPPISILKNNIDMMLLNINPIWEGNYPVPPNVIYMGGLHQKPPKELPKDLQNYLDSSNQGVIYFSFGTNVRPSLLPAEKIAIFEKVFAKLPYNVIWKWDNDNFSVKSDNIKIFRWLPQSDLLRHPNVKVFITQGGLQSTDEAITAGVPLVGVPMLIDQWYNVEKYVHHKIGVRLDLEDITEQKLTEALIEVAEDKSYRDNIIRLRSVMQDQPQTPLERTMWWIEYVLRHKGAKHLRAPTANMSWTEFLELELLFVVTFGFFTLMALTVLISRFILLYVLKNIVPNLKLKTA